MTAWTKTMKNLEADLIEEYYNMVQAHLDNSLRELAEVIDREREENPDKYFGIGVYGDE